MSPLELFSDELEKLVERAAPQRGGRSSTAAATAPGWPSPPMASCSPTRTWCRAPRACRCASTTARGSRARWSAATRPPIWRWCAPAGRTRRCLPLATAAQVKVGQVVLALGHPFGFERSVSLGVVSALERRLPGRDGATLDGLIQTDAAINPGNSGGPLLNVRGQVVGINTAMLPFAQGIGFAVPSSTATWVSALLLRHGEVRRRFLGIAAKNETLCVPSWRLRLGQPRGGAGGGDRPRHTRVGRRPRVERRAAAAQRRPAWATVDDLQRLLALDAATMVELTVWKRDAVVQRQVGPRRRRPEGGGHSSLRGVTAGSVPDCVPAGGRGLEVLGGHVDDVPRALLAPVHRAIRRSRPASAWILRVLGVRGDADAGADAQAEALAREEAVPLDRSANALGHLERAARVGAAQQDHVLVAAPAAHDVVVAHAVLEHPGHLHQQLASPPGGRGCR